MQEMEQSSEGVSVRNRLLNAAEAVVARDGVNNLTLEAVAREAGVSKGGLLYHFPSKSALVTGVVERLGSECECEQEEILRSCDGTAGSFTRAYVQVRSQPLKPEEVPVHTALLAAVGTDSQLLDAIREKVARWQERLESDGIDPVMAHIVRLAVDGLWLDELLKFPVPQGTMRQDIIDRLMAMSHEPGKDHG